MTDIHDGLSSSKVEELKLRGLSNIPVGNQSKTIGQIVAGNVFTYFNFVFAIFAGLLIFVRSYYYKNFLSDGIQAFRLLQLAFYLFYLYLHIIYYIVAHIY